MTVFPAFPIGFAAYFAPWGRKDGQYFTGVSEGMSNTISDMSIWLSSSSATHCGDHQIAQQKPG